MALVASRFTYVYLSQRMLTYHLDARMLTYAGQQVHLGHVWHYH